MKIKNVLIVLLITLGILLVPLTLQLTVGTGVDGEGFNWTLSDFVVMGVIIFIFGLGVNLAMTKLGKYRILGAVVLVILFLWLWAELAVGVFTNWGS